MVSSSTLTSVFAVSIRTAEGEWPIAEVAGWDLEVVEEGWDGPGQQVRFRANWRGTRPTRAGLVVRRRIAGSAPCRVLVPAVFYGDNGQGNQATRYPRLGPLDRDAFTAPAWDFVAERTALPAVFAWGEGEFTWLAVEPQGTGVGFSLVDGAAELRVHRPGLERPFRHDRLDESPLLAFVDLAPGGALEVTVWHGDGPADDPGAFAPIARALQATWGGAHTRPIERKLLRAAADAAAAGLLHWHYRPDLAHGVLVEVVSFDGSQGREEMHVAWVSGAPAAYALLQHGLAHGDLDAVAAGRAVLDTVASGLAPCGAFWGLWTPNGWRGGWNGHPRKLHARTLAEATLFLVRALALEPEHPAWVAAVRSNLDFCLGAMDESGHPGSYYHAETGEVLDRRGTAGLLWVAALAEAASLLGAPQYAAAALRAGDAYAAAIRAGRLLGAPEDVGFCPSSEDGYNALIAMMALHRASGDAHWLALARAAADWMLTFRWAYDVHFPAGSPLARRNFRTRGGDGASASNNHLHPYGLICQPELLRLSAATGDPWYAARAADHLACFAGEIALQDHAFGGPERRGMLSEQWYTTNWSREGRAGDVVPIAHAWTLGLLLLAADEWLADGAPAPRARSAAPAQASPRRTTDQPHAVRLLPGFYQVGGGYLSHQRDAASYLLADETTGECLLVDCGSHSGLPALRANILQVADLQQLRFVIGTHGHWDHVEAFAHLRDEAPARFAIHALDAPAVQCGHPDLTCAGFLYNEPFHPFPVDLLLEGGEQFQIGAYELEILHLPGHSPGCIGVLARYAGTGQTILIPGDSVAGGFSKRTHSSVAAWKRSMRRLLAAPPDLMVPNHLPPGSQTALLGDVANRLARIYSQLQTDFHNFMDHQRT